MGMFANAKVAADPKSKKGKKEEVAIPTPDLHLFAALKAVHANVEAQMSVVEAGIKAGMMARFVEQGAATGRKPESYKGEENGSTASLQFRIKASSSALSEAECSLLDDYDIPYDESVSRVETFIINPDYADLTDEKNAEMLAKVEEALSKLGLPADFIQRQEKVSKQIVTEATIDAVCGLKTRKGESDLAAIAALMPVVGVLGIRAKLAEGANPFAIVEAELGSPDNEEDKVAA